MAGEAGVAVEDGSATFSSGSATYSGSGLPGREVGLEERVEVGEAGFSGFGGGDGSTVANS